MGPSLVFGDWIWIDSDGPSPSNVTGLAMSTTAVTNEKQYTQIVYTVHIASTLTKMM